MPAKKQGMGPKIRPRETSHEMWQRYLKERWSINEALEKEVRKQAAVYKERSDRRKGIAKHAKSSRDIEDAQVLVEKAAQVVDKLIELLADRIIENLELVDVVWGVLGRYEQQGSSRAMWFHHVMSGAVKSDVSVELAARYSSSINLLLMIFQGMSYILGMVGKVKGFLSSALAYTPHGPAIGEITGIVTNLVDASVLPVEHRSVVAVGKSVFQWGKAGLAYLQWALAFLESFALRCVLNVLLKDLRPSAEDLSEDLSGSSTKGPKARVVSEPTPAGMLTLTVATQATEESEPQLNVAHRDGSSVGGSEREVVKTPNPDLSFPVTDRRDSKLSKLAVPPATADIKEPPEKLEFGAEFRKSLTRAIDNILVPLVPSGTLTAGSIADLTTAFMTALSGNGAFQETPLYRMTVMHIQSMGGPEGARKLKVCPYEALLYDAARTVRVASTFGKPEFLVINTLKWNGLGHVPGKARMIVKLALLYTLMAYAKKAQSFWTGEMSAVRGRGAVCAHKEGGSVAEASMTEYIVGRMYLDGHGETQSDSEASAWYERAAEKGHALAQLGLAELSEKKGSNKMAAKYRERAEKANKEEKSASRVVRFAAEAYLHFALGDAALPKATHTLQRTAAASAYQCHTNAKKPYVPRHYELQTVGSSIRWMGKDAAGENKAQRRHYYLQKRTGLIGCFSFIFAVDASVSWALYCEPESGVTKPVSGVLRCYTLLATSKDGGDSPKEFRLLETQWIAHNKGEVTTLEFTPLSAPAVPAGAGVMMEACKQAAEGGVKEVVADLLSLGKHRGRLFEAATAAVVWHYELIADKQGYYGESQKVADETKTSRKTRRGELWQQFVMSVQCDRIVAAHMKRHLLWGYGIDNAAGVGILRGASPYAAGESLLMRAEAMASVAGASPGGITGLANDTMGALCDLMTSACLYGIRVCLSESYELAQRVPKPCNMRHFQSDFKVRFEGNSTQKQKLASDAAEKGGGNASSVSSAAALGVVGESAPLNHTRHYALIGTEPMRADAADAAKERDELCYLPAEVFADGGVPVHRSPRLVHAHRWQKGDEDLTGHRVYPYQNVREGPSGEVTCEDMNVLARGVVADLMRVFVFEADRWTEGHKITRIVIKIPLVEGQVKGLLLWILAEFADVDINDTETGDEIYAKSRLWAVFCVSSFLGTLVDECVATLKSKAGLMSSVMQYVASIAASALGDLPMVEVLKLFDSSAAAELDAVCEIIGVCMLAALRSVPYRKLYLVLPFLRHGMSGKDATCKRDVHV
jgi:hypothetical protein